MNPRSLPHPGPGPGCVPAHVITPKQFIEAVLTAFCEGMVEGRDPEGHLGTASAWRFSDRSPRRGLVERFGDALVEAVENAPKEGR